MFTSYQMDVSGPDVFFLSRDGARAELEPVEFRLPGTYTIDFTITNDAGAVVFADSSGRRRGAVNGWAEQQRSDPRSGDPDRGYLDPLG